MITYNNPYSTTLTLYDYSKTFGDKNVEIVALNVLNDERFNLWSGSSKSNEHHYGKNGLTIHTLEVYRLCLSTIQTLYHYEVDTLEMFFSSLFHDSGKMFDYKPINDTYMEWEGTDHKRLIHHISRSGLIWSSAISEFPKLYDKYHDKVLHNILSHHGRREWGSPVAPKTREAWLLHLCDGLSARMNDCNKIDLVKL